jgi:hypothetical protein
MKNRSPQGHRFVHYKLKCRHTMKGHTCVRYHHHVDHFKQNDGSGNWEHNFMLKETNKITFVVSTTRNHVTGVGELKDYTTSGTSNLTRHATQRT